MHCGVLLLARAIVKGFPRRVCTVEYYCYQGLLSQGSHGVYALWSITASKGYCHRVPLVCVPCGVLLLARATITGPHGMYALWSITASKGYCHRVPTACMHWSITATKCYCHRVPTACMHCGVLLQARLLSQGSLGVCALWSNTASKGYCHRFPWHVCTLEYYCQQGLLSQVPMACMHCGVLLLARAIIVTGFPQPLESVEKTVEIGNIMELGT